jgi:tetraacyldisaccharide 4'-kinase
MRFVKRTDRADQVGDEPLLTRHKLAESSNVVVSRSRLEAIKELQESVPPGLIILDDALQHRQVNAHVTILLTTHDQPYSDDCLVPCGYLRDLKSRAGAAQIIIVTKCPADVIPDNSQWRRKLQLTDDQSLYFSRYLTGPPIELTSEFDGGRVSIPADAPIVVISGIAQNADFAAYVKQHHDHVAEAGFKDHHGFTATDIATTLGKFPNFAGGQKWLVTTEKDAVRLLPFLDQLKKENVRVAMLPIQVQIIGSETELINELKQYVG